mgnify:CR=1 FL=1
MGRLRQVARSETDDPFVLGMYDLIFGKDVDPVGNEATSTSTGSAGDWWTTHALSPDILEHAVGPDDGRPDPRPTDINTHGIHGLLSTNWPSS